MQLPRAVAVAEGVERKQQQRSRAAGAVFALGVVMELGAAVLYLAGGILREEGQAWPVPSGGLIALFAGGIAVQFLARVLWVRARTG